MRPLFCLCALAALAGCDLTPTLDVDLPPHERALFVSGVVAADSAIAVRAGVSRDPYAVRTFERFGALKPELSVLLRRDGQPDVPLAERQCEGYDYETGELIVAGCGVYETAASVGPGETASLVARSEGLPDAVATFTMPLRPDASLLEALAETREPSPGQTITEYAVSLELRDRPGLDRYALGVVATRTFETCTFDPETEECAPRLASTPKALFFTTVDPLLVAASREIETGGYALIAFDDQEFEGRARTFRLDTEIYDGGFYDGGFSASVAQPRVQLSALSSILYEVRNIVQFSPGEGNPFAEVEDLPSNVEGGYGIVGAVTLWEARLEAE